MIIYDALNSPVYRSGTKLQILPRDNVAAVIEVKSKLNKDQLTDAAVEGILAEPPYDPVNPLGTGLFPYAESALTRSRHFGAPAAPSVSQSTLSGPPPAPGPSRSKNVFIVHGHNEGLKDATAYLVKKLGLEPVILHEQENSGRTIIEKFDDYAKGVGFAIVLLSADDEGRAKDAGSLQPQPRARQNVIFEMGFFFGHLGRMHVCAVRDTGVEKPSDIDGILYIPYDTVGKWKHDVAKELKAAGYDVDLSKV